MKDMMSIILITPLKRKCISNQGVEKLYNRIFQHLAILCAMPLLTFISTIRYNLLIQKEEKREYSMFVDFRKYHWVLPVYLYKDQASLIASLKDEIIQPADKKARELAIKKAKRLERL